METWYRTGGFGKNLIKPISVIKSTEKTLTVTSTDWNGRASESRMAISSQYYRHFRTWEEAHAHLLEKAEANIESIRRNLERAKGHLGNIRWLKKPD